MFAPLDHADSLPPGLRFSCSFLRSGSRIITAAVLNASAARKRMAAVHFFGEGAFHPFTTCYDCGSVIAHSRKLITALIWIAALRCAHGQSIDCANNVDAESRGRTGPGGVVAVLKVHSEDDHNKNSHQCEANYTLQIVLPDGRDGAAGLIPPMGFTSSVGEWGRRLSVHLDGFSNDGQHIFGVISEGGKYSFVQVFDFKRDGSHVEMQIQQGLSNLKAANCGTSFAVAGTANAGEIVLEPNTADRCRIDHRWLVNKAGNLRDLPKSDSFTPLYTPGKP
jgi:hypothetical protein